MHPYFNSSFVCTHERLLVDSEGFFVDCREIFLEQTVYPDDVPTFSECYSHLYQRFYLIQLLGKHMIYLEVIFYFFTGVNYRCVVSPS